MDPEHRDSFDRLQDLAANDDFDAGHMPDVVSMDGVLNGSERINISHAGGEFGTLEEDIEEDTDGEEEKAKYVGLQPECENITDYVYLGRQRTGEHGEIIRKHATLVSPVKWTTWSPPTCITVPKTSSVRPSHQDREKPW